MILDLHATAIDAPPCPGCGAVAPAGTYPAVHDQPTDWWCRACLQAKCSAARADLSVCHCSQTAGTHIHRINQTKESNQP